jgi:protein-L-isoaspartate O-methyltransferase
VTLTPEDRARSRELKATAAQHRRHAALLDDARRETAPTDHDRVSFLKWAARDHRQQAKAADKERQDIWHRAHIAYLLTRPHERRRTDMAKARSTTLRELADKLQKDIDAKRNPATASQNLTPRRVRVIEGMRADARRLELVQAAMRTMADAFDAAAHNPSAFTSDPLLARYGTLGTRAAFERLSTADLEAIAGKPQPSAADRLRELELSLVGTKIPGFFPTPAPVVARMLQLADIEPGHYVLEPSAGKGDIADALRALAAPVTLEVCEVNYTLRSILTAKGLQVIAHDFLGYTPDEARATHPQSFQGGYDRIVMNPPFEQLADIDHVRHAWAHLRPGGRLVAIVCESAFSRGDKKAKAFREWLDGYDALGCAKVEKVERGAFTGPQAFRQTGVACRIVVLDKPAAPADTEDCDECGAAIPEAPDLVNAYHAASCSLHPSAVQASTPEAPAAQQVTGAANSKSGRAGVDWRAAGLKAAETRRRNAAARAAAAAQVTS